MKKAIIYGDSQAEGFIARGERLSYFYLHGKAEEKNGYDCCNANITAFTYAIRNLLFFAELKYPDGGFNKCIVVPHISCGSINGRIVLINDLPALKDAMAHRRNEFRMYEHEKQLMKTTYPETYKFLIDLQKQEA